jgi:hypothetical protein
MDSYIIDVVRLQIGEYFEEKRSQILEGRGQAPSFYL